MYSHKLLTGAVYSSVLEYYSVADPDPVITGPDPDPVITGPDPPNC